jgi:MFS family permease
VKPSQIERVSGKAWLLLAILVLMLVLAYLDRGLIALLVKPMRESLHVSDVQISLLYGMAFGLFYALFSFPLGWLADRWSRRGVIYLCITLWSLATAACGLAGTFWQLAAARFMIGFGEGGLSPIGYRMLGDAFPKRRMGLALGIFGAGAGLAAPISLLVGGRLVDWALHGGGAGLPLIGDVQPWQRVFLILGPPGVLLAPLIFLAPAGRKSAPVEPQRSDNSGPSFESMGLLAFLRSRWLYLLLVFMGFGVVALFCYGIAAWTPTYFQRRFGLTMTQIGAGLALANGLATTTCFVASGWLTDRWFSHGAKTAQFLYFLICLPIVILAGVLAFTVADRPVFAFILLGFVWLLVPTVTTAATHLQHSTPVHLRGRVSALFTMVFNIVGMTTGPLVVAMLTEHVFHDPAKVGLAIATTLIVAGGLALVLFGACLKPARNAIAMAEA